MGKPMQRVMIIGQPGSGKSWLAREMGKVTGLPVYHMDHIHWKPGWIEREPKDKLRLVSAVHDLEEWILEGGLSRSWDERLARADTCIWLDFPLWFRAACVVRRTLKHYGRTRPDLPEGCPEQFSWEFARWIWTTRRSGRVKPAAIFATPDPHCDLVRLRTRAEVATFLHRLRGLTPPSGAD